MVLWFLGILGIVIPSNKEVLHWVRLLLNTHLLTWKIAFLFTGKFLFPAVQLLGTLSAFEKQTLKQRLWNRPCESQGNNFVKDQRNASNPTVIPLEFGCGQRFYAIVLISVNIVSWTFILRETDFKSYIAKKKELHSKVESLWANMQSAIDFTLGNIVLKITSHSE